MSKKKTHEELKSIALKYSNYTEFYKKESSVCMIARKLGILDEICSHMKRTRSKIITENQIRDLALACKTFSEFRNRYPSAYRAAIRSNILKKVCSHMQKLHMSWTNAMLHAEALKYKNKIDFIKNSHSAYLTSTNRGILDEICSHMEPIYNQWTLDKLKKVANNYKTTKDFIKNDPAAYSAACKQKLLDKICSHMIKSISSSEQELFILNRIKFFFPKAHKILDRNVKIETSPQIKSFEIDIYVPELSKGIEFDGKFYHSFIGLKRSRPKWPDADLNNYHEIKDAYFASKGIELLHIKEIDWNLSKDECIFKIEKFLGITGFALNSNLQKAI